MKTIELN